MTSKELNLKLIEIFPEIKNTYLEETSWQDGDETGSHIVYGDVFVPFLKREITEKRTQILTNIFMFIEELLELNDNYVNEVIAFSVFESLLFDDEVDNAFLIQYAKSNALKIIEEIIKEIGE